MSNDFAVFLRVSACSSPSVCDCVKFFFNLFGFVLFVDRAHLLLSIFKVVDRPHPLLSNFKTVDRTLVCLFIPFLRSKTRQHDIAIIMDNYLLPATRYEPPVWQVRKRVLNTIIEDEHSEDEEGSYIEEEPDAEARGRKRNSLDTRSAGSASPVPSLTSSISCYRGKNRHSWSFDELYDVSDEESVGDQEVAPSRLTHSMNAHPPSPQKPPGLRTRNRYPSIVIPSPSHWPTIQKLQKISPMISPAPPPKIPLSPAVLSLLSRDLPSSSQPPSLDGSLISDPHACSTAPVTPDMPNQPESRGAWGKLEIKQRPNSNLFNGVKEPEFNIRDVDWDHLDSFGFEDGTVIHDLGSDTGVAFADSPVLGVEDNVSEAGVQLPAEALLTLQHLSLEVPLKLESVTDTDSVGEMEEVPSESLRRRTVDMTPISQMSDYSLDQLSIPSPGVFFSSLASNARHTWCVTKSGSSSAVPPSTTTAEYFYNCPWSTNPQATVEQILEIDDHSTEGPPTARQMPFLPPVQEHATPPTAILPQIGTPISDCNEDYEKEIQKAAENSLDRTSVWLAAQSSYMAVLRETNPLNKVGLDTTVGSKRGSRHVRNDSLESPMKKAVRFLETETAKREKSDENNLRPGDSIYYHAFQHISNDVEAQDAFTHRQERTDAVQASRNCLPHEHLDRLQGNYSITKADRPAPPRPISMFPGKEADEAEQTVEQKAISRVERERQALQQLNTSMWIVEASRFLNGGKLLNSPVVKDLATRSHKGDSTTACMRVLDLGGLPNCDWAWHCACEYPNSKVYTATTDAHLINDSIRGPSNHRCNTVSKLWELPYADNHFDGISARSLFTYLKNEKPLGRGYDEYDLCLRECLRCLKPGGYLEFFLLDSEIINSGSRGTAASVEFGFNLKTRGYDPMPTKNWLGRLRRAGFDDIKRAWTFLPMGAPQKPLPELPETPPPDVATYNAKPPEAVRGPVGSTADAANVAGLLGSWAWEQWMLKLQMEMGKEQLLEGVGAVLEEGKFTGAGWRCLSGWARKPEVDENPLRI